jgi:hypothetical protein
LPEKTVALHSCLPLDLAETDCGTFRGSTRCPLTLGAMLHHEGAYEEMEVLVRQDCKFLFAGRQEYCWSPMTQLRYIGPQGAPIKSNTTRLGTF